jgi:excisionase family DNA binding protein
MPQLLTIDEAAAYLRQPVKTLRNWRSEGRGPASMKLGRRVLYDKTDLDAWVEQRKRNGTP